MKAPKSENKTFELVPAGNHVARVFQIIHVGTLEEEYMGESKLVDKIRLTFELPNKTKEFKEGEGEKPYSVSREFTFSMHEKSNLRPIVEGIIGVSLHDEEAESFDFDNLLGKTCLLHVVHKTSRTGREYALIQSASPLPDGMEAPEAVNEAKVYDINEMTQEEIDAMPQFIKEKMESSKEYQARFNPVRPTTENEVSPDDIPF